MSVDRSKKFNILAKLENCEVILYFVYKYILYTRKSTYKSIHSKAATGSELGRPRETMTENEGGKN